MKFKYFQTEAGEKVNSIRIYLGSLNINPFLDDVEVDMEIVNGDIVFDILDKHYYDKEDINHIQNTLKELDWENGYEYFNLSDNNTNKDFYIVGDSNSEMYNILNSTKNQQNLKNISNILNKI
jgi:hypothetical protein